MSTAPHTIPEMPHRSQTRARGAPCANASRESASWVCMGPGGSARPRSPPRWPRARARGTACRWCSPSTPQSGSPAPRWGGTRRRRASPDAGRAEALQAAAVRMQRRAVGDDARCQAHLRRADSSPGTGRDRPATRSSRTASIASSLRRSPARRSSPRSPSSSSSTARAASTRSCSTRPRHATRWTSCGAVSPAASARGARLDIVWSSPLAGLAARLFGGGSALLSHLLACHGRRADRRPLGLFPAPARAFATGCGSAPAPWSACCETRPRPS